MHLPPARQIVHSAEARVRRLTRNYGMPRQYSTDGARTCEKDERMQPLIKNV
jgi:hypothetical protein